MTNISASAISRILSSNTSLKKAPTSNCWGKGFIVTGYGVEVGVTYQDTDRIAVDRCLDHVAETINARADRKYFAEKLVGAQGGLYVKIVLRTDEHNTDDAKEKLAEESEHAVTVAEVRKVIQPGRYEYTDAPGNRGAGYVIERAEGFQSRLVRVTYRDHPHTAYALVEGGREGYKASTVERYATDLTSAGYAAWIEFEENDGWSVLVGPADAFVGQDSPEDVRTALNELREAVEADALSYMTRKAGPHSLFVYYLIPFKDKLRRLEVFWRGGRYSASGRFGGPSNDFYNLPHLVEYIGRELKD